MPTTKQRLSINLDDSEYSVLAGLAEKYNISMAWIGRKAIREFLDRHRENSLQLPLTFSQQTERPKWLNEPR